MFRSYFVEYVFVLNNQTLLTFFYTFHRRKFPFNARYISVIT